jgi:hypothetical protein
MEGLVAALPSLQTAGWLAVKKSLFSSGKAAGCENGGAEAVAAGDRCALVVGVTVTALPVPMVPEAATPLSTGLRILAPLR